jgi:hypothetical protein
MGKYQAHIAVILGRDAIALADDRIVPPGHLHRPPVARGRTHRGPGARGRPARANGPLRHRRGRARRRIPGQQPTRHRRETRRVVEAPPSSAPASRSCCTQLPSPSPATSLSIGSGTRCPRSRPSARSGSDASRPRTLKERCPSRVAAGRRCGRADWPRARRCRGLLRAHRAGSASFRITSAQASGGPSLNGSGMCASDYGLSAITLMTVADVPWNAPSTDTSGSESSARPPSPLSFAVSKTRRQPTVSTRPNGSACTRTSLG